MLCVYCRACGAALLRCYRLLPRLPACNLCACVWFVWTLPSGYYLRLHYNNNVNM
jgi:hypothetical protein